MFHLFTHAYFKALLFLGAGSVMHSMGNVIDIREFGGLRRVMPITHATFLVGALALAGIPPLSGFWSKDEILVVVSLAAHEGTRQTLFGWLQIGVLLTSGLTAFYIFRAYFLTFWGETRFPKAAGHHPHESPPVMAYPLVVLAIPAALLGLVVGPTHYFFHFVSHAPGLQGEPHPLSSGAMATGTLVGLAGTITACWVYVAHQGMATTWAKRFAGFYNFSLGKFFFDELYSAVLVKPLEGIAALSAAGDKSVVDRFVDWSAGRPSWLGRWFRNWQSGLIQFYAAMMFVGLTLLTAYLVWVV